MKIIISSSIITWVIWSNQGRHAGEQRGTRPQQHSMASHAFVYLHLLFDFCFCLYLGRAILPVPGVNKLPSHLCESVVIL